MTMFQRSSLRYAHSTGHTGLTYTKDGDLIITCGSDGDIRRWTDIEDDDPTSNCLGEFVVCVEHGDDGRLLASTDRNTVQAFTFPAMDSDGTLMRFTALVTCLRSTKKYIAAGSEDTTIKVQRIGEEELQLDGHVGPVLALDICEQMALLASVAGDGQLKVWNLDSGALLKTIEGLAKTNSFEGATCFGTPTFEPQNGNALVFVKGKSVHVLSTSTWELLYTLSDEHASGDYTCCQFTSDGQWLAAATRTGEISVFDVSRQQAMRTEAPSVECKAITCLAWKPGSNQELAYCDATGQLGTLFASCDKDAGVNGNGNHIEDAVDFGDIDFDGDDGSKDGDDDDDDGVSIERLKRKVMRDTEATDEDSRGSLLRSATDIEVPPAIIVAPKQFKQQSPFQPSATPSHLEHRYLVWNDIGIVSGHADNADGSIEVEFHDASVHHSLHIPNYNHHDMASLSASVLALSGAGANKIVCIALAASGNKEWSLALPDCELVEALATTSRLVAVATSVHFLRLFTVMGTQREIITLPGPVLAMTGHDERLLVVYHSAAPGPSQQHLAAFLVQTQGMRVRVQQIAVPLPPKRQLSWVGFSDCGSPAFADSMGLVQLFSVRSNCWYPVCDTQHHCQSVSYNYFVIALSERNQIVQALMCRGSTYPMTSPRPMTQELPMNLPLCDAESEKSQLEDVLVRSSSMSVTNADKLIKETAIKLFALACRSEIEVRAKELIETIACPELLLLAVKYASKSGRIHLSDRLQELMSQVEALKQRETDDTLGLAADPILNLSTTSINSPNTASSVELAPKRMELTLAKRAALKRFSVSNTPTATLKRLVVPELSPTATSNEYVPDSQTGTENLADSEEPATQDSHLSGYKPINRSSVNPFAAKRKLAEADFSFGSEKLKLLKK